MLQVLSVSVGTLGGRSQLSEPNFLLLRRPRGVHRICVCVCTMGLLIVPESHYTVPVLVSRCKEKKWVEGNFFFSLFFSSPPFYFNVEICCNKWNGATVS